MINNDIKLVQTNLKIIYKNDYSDYFEEQVKIARSIINHYYDNTKLSQKQWNFIHKFNDDVEMYPYNSKLHALVWDIKYKIYDELNEITL